MDDLHEHLSEIFGTETSPWVTGVWPVMLDRQQRLAHLPAPPVRVRSRRARAIKRVQDRAARGRYYAKPEKRAAALEYQRAYRAKQKALKVPKVHTATVPVKQFQPIASGTVGG